MHVLLEAQRWDKSSKGKYVELEKYIGRKHWRCWSLPAIRGGRMNKSDREWMTCQTDGKNENSIS